ncbi:MAG TPA: thiamine pyrophosphate-dependent enzyme [Geminicoccus sp.]|jgi:thiamine pyrophosphate-dependent acetolactate synthase large subunit-like protein|uniref:thiamine pyrophosphate-dependent enzyme n=1 Tax=Geminicoccus sp. TaxID=2024832 RepID=UPI002E361087|nr:thiamine pyrophosphate-dependent enzyme [Geminicoccus sp.]HEX2528913.1 thiamine pyrophosphate-dependent enzyme [Geminicoccus sp.]
MSSRNGADILIDSLIAWGVDTIFGMPGDGINGIMESIRHHQGRIRFIQVRHEESAALMACAHAKITGRLGCCLATTGPGGVHLLNGLYDAAFDGAPVIAVTGLPYHDLVDTGTQQDIDHTKLFQDVALYTARIMSPAHVENVVALACRTALAGRGVAHVAIAVDVQEDSEDSVEPSPRNVGHHTSFARADELRVPHPEDIERAAAILNGGQRIAILAGQGAKGAKEELLRTADLLGAPIIKALLGKSVVPDSHPLTTGGVGLLGTRPSQDALENCDTLLIVGSTFPYIEYYPKPGQARGVQIDRDPTRIGLRFPVEVGLAGDARAALELLNARLARKDDRSFLEQAQAGMAEWRELLRSSVERPGAPMKPGRIARDLGDRLADDAIVAWDSGHNTGLLARYVEARPGQEFFGSGLLATMACGIPYAVAAALAFPGRQVVAFVGDGGLAMLLGELATVVRYRLPIKIVVVKNNTLGQIKWEQMQFLGNPEYECDLTPIDFAKVAEGFGIRSFRVEDPDACGLTLDEALAHPGPALVEAVIDPNEPFLPPKRRENYVKNLEKALEAGTPGREELQKALAEEPSRSLLRA